MDTKPASVSSRSPKFVRWAVMLGIIVALNVFFIVVRSLLFTAPVYETFCPSPSASPTTEQVCSTQGGTWVPVGADQATPPGAVKPMSPSNTGYCDLYAKCQKPFQAAQDQYQLYTFVLMIGLGVLALIVGVLPLGSAIVSTGLSYGGVLAFIIGSVQYWGDAGKWVRFGIALIALGALIYIGIKRFRDDQA